MIRAASWHRKYYQVHISTAGRVSTHLRESLFRCDSCFGTEVDRVDELVHETFLRFSDRLLHLENLCVFEHVEESSLSTDAQKHRSATFNIKRERSDLS